GWVPAEYGMLPRATGERMARAAARGKQSGRTQEIQRLIGRSLRAVVDLEGLGEVQIKVDCDVIQADGGTRTAAIPGGFVALSAALQHRPRLGVIGEIPVASPVAAVSCGVFRGETVLDLDYLEDSTAMADATFVLSGDGGIVEIQATAEEEPFGDEAFAEMMRLARKGVAELTALQADALGISEVAPEEESASEDEKPDTAST
ncbi:MAG: ribonuclease PH, partial [Rhodospirillales bacterium]